DEQVYVLHVRQTRRGDGEVVLHADVPGVEDRGGPGPEQHARRPQDVAALGERHRGVPDLERLAERHGHEPLADLMDGRPARQAAAHRRVVVERAHYELRRRRGAV
ncbi:MAG: hypothetical protein AVDCRST_MAG01-01-2458, partial [uncultured Rubrobacteraceae bacterium]